METTHKINVDLVQRAGAQPFEAGEILEGLRDKVDAARTTYCKAARAYGLSHMREFGDAYKRLTLIQNERDQCSAALEQAKKLTGIAKMTGDPSVIAQHEEKIRELSERVERLNRDEREAFGYRVFGSAEKYEELAAAEAALHEITLEARQTRFAIADAIEDKIEELRELLRKATDGIPQNVVVDAPLTFYRMEQRHEGPTVEEMITNAVEFTAEHQEGVH